MIDICTALLIIALASTAMFAVTLKVANGASSRWRAVLLTVVVALIVAYVVVLHDRVYVARLIPLSSAIIIGNIVPVLAAVAFALVWGAPGIGKARKAILLGVLIAVTLRLVYRPVIGSPPTCGDLWENDVCMQTTESTCGAAAGATLLKHHGVPATEDEMARLCLTRNGTLRLGIYRGLKLKTANTPFHVEVFSADVAELRRKAASGPVLLFVGLRRGQKADSRYARDWGWTRGLRHAVVLFGFEDGDMIDIGDPTFGREKWRVEALDVLWDGWAMRLARRQRRSRDRGAGIQESSGA